MSASTHSAGTATHSAGTAKVGYSALHSLGMMNREEVKKILKHLTLFSKDKALFNSQRIQLGSVTVDQIYLIIFSHCSLRVNYPLLMKCTTLQ